MRSRECERCERLGECSRSRECERCERRLECSRSGEREMWSSDWCPFILRFSDEVGDAAVAGPACTATADSDGDLNLRLHFDFMSSELYASRFVVRTASGLITTMHSTMINVLTVLMQIRLCLALLQRTKYFGIVEYWSIAKPMKHDAHQSLARQTGSTCRSQIRTALQQSQTLAACIARPDTARWRCGPCC